jgi:hypothetical protein
MKNMQWTRVLLGFLGFLGFLGLPAITRGEWKEALWFLFFTWFFYFIPVKMKEQ